MVGLPMNYELDMYGVVDPDRLRAYLRSIGWSQSVAADDCYLVPREDGGSIEYGGLEVWQSPKMVFRSVCWLDMGIPGTWAIQVRCVIELLACIEGVPRDDVLARVLS